MKHSFSCLGIFAGIISCSLLFSPCSYAQDSSNNEEESLPQETATGPDATEKYLNSEDFQKLQALQESLYDDYHLPPSNSDYETKKKWVIDRVNKIREKWKSIDFQKLKDENPWTIAQRKKSQKPFENITIDPEDIGKISFGKGLTIKVPLTLSFLGKNISSV